MIKSPIKAALVAAAACLAATLSQASAIKLNFEGLGSQAQVRDFYNGGTDSMGNAGTNYGISFGSNTLAVKESDPAANFSGEPSRETIMFFLSGTAVLNYAPGFTDGFSFYYTTTNFSASVQVYDGLNATGNLLGQIRLAALGDGPDPENDYSNWAIGSLGFSGLAKSINFGGTVNRVGYDNITFGSTDPRDLPEPGSLALGLMGLAAVAGVRRVRKA